MKKVIGVVILIVIIFISGYTIYNIYQEIMLKNETQPNTQAIIENYNNKQIEIEQTKVEETPQNLGLVPEAYKGYKVCAKLQIEKLNIDTYILQEYSKKAMEVAIVKFFGANPNEIGNFCIAGHNYVRKNMFSKLGTLKKGDSIIITDNYHGAISYTVYDIFTVKPNQTQTLSQKTNGEKQVTLITCSNYSDTRIIVKAKMSH